MFELSTHVEDLNKLKSIDVSLFDAFYLGDATCPEYPDNLAVGFELLKEAVFYLKEKGKKCYLSTYAVPRNKDLSWVEDMIVKASELPVDGFEVHNMGVLRIINRSLGKAEVHMGYFANVYTHETVKVLEKFGVKRVFLNPELSLDEIQYVNEHTEAEVVAFAHGKIPLGISEDCFIKEYREGSCRDICEPMWLTSGKWKLKNIGRATFSGKDWAIIEYLGTFYYRGFRVFYIQGLRENTDYINRIGSIYRRALERIVEGDDDYLEPSWIEEIASLSPHGICNGYLFRRAGHRYVGRFFGGEKVQLKREVLNE